KIERVASRLLGFREDAIAHGLRPDTAVLSRGYEPVGEDDGSLLDVPPSDLVYRVTRLRTTDGEPIGLNVVVLLPDVAAEPDGADYTASLYDEVARLLGREVARADQTVEAVNGREADCELLGVTPSAPLLRVTRVTYLDSGRLIGLTRTLYRGDRYYLSLRVDRSEPTLTGWAREGPPRGAAASVGGATARPDDPRGADERREERDPRAGRDDERKEHDMTERTRHIRPILAALAALVLLPFATA